LIEDGRHLVGFEITQGWRGPSLCRDAEHLRTVARDEGFSIGDEAEEAPEGRESTVPRPDRGVAIVFAVPKERQDFGFGQVREGELRDRSRLACRDKAKKQPPRVAIREHRMAREVPLTTQPIFEEGMQEKGKCRHG
jgi:hypothetical protein